MQYIMSGVDIKALYHKTELKSLVWFCLTPLISQSIPSPVCLDSPVIQVFLGRWLWLC